LILPPPISPLVDMADIDKAVTKVMNVEMAMMTNVSPLFKLLFLFLNEYVRNVIL
jgi:hypothetical protein